MRKFDTKVQLLKYRVLREVARHAFAGRLLEKVMDIPQMIVPGRDATMRCCVYKERAILNERVKLAMGGDKDNPNVIEVIEIACDECPVSGYVVSEACRGCIAHRCEDACKRNAIIFDSHQRAVIDKNRCIECGLCARVCPYKAINNNQRPCEIACKIKAITRGQNHEAIIDNKKCTACGACVYQCPFGAITDKSMILDVIKLLTDKREGQRVYAVVAPSIASQFTYARLGQVISGIKALGFYHVVEAALGADLVADAEARELSSKQFLISSCCPAFVHYVQTQFPAMREHLSENFSPMVAIARVIKQSTPDAKVVFIGPCTAKKAESRISHIRPWVDGVLTFEELQALFDSRDLDLSGLPEDFLDNASYYGRILARTGGLSDAVRQGLIECGQGDFVFEPVVCDGIEACRVALLKASKNVLAGNFIEGMACDGGCIGGAGCLTHGEKNKADVDRYGREAYEKTITDAIGVLRSAGAYCPPFISVIESNRVGFDEHHS